MRAFAVNLHSENKQMNSTMKVARSTQDKIAAALQRTCYFCFTIVMVLIIIWLAARK